MHLFSSLLLNVRVTALMENVLAISRGLINNFFFFLMKTSAIEGPNRLKKRLGLFVEDS